MWLRDFVETVFGLLLFVNAGLFIPQIIKLYKKKESRDLSFLTFFGFCGIQVFTILHGFLFHDILLIIGNFLSLLSCGAVTLMILIYRKK